MVNKLVRFGAGLKLFIYRVYVFICTLQWVKDVPMLPGRIRNRTRPEKRKRLRRNAYR